MALSTNLEEALTQISADIDAEFDSLLAIPDDTRAPLYEAMRHAAIGGANDYARCWWLQPQSV